MRVIWEQNKTYCDERLVNLLSRCIQTVNIFNLSNFASPIHNNRAKFPCESVRCLGVLPSWIGHSRFSVQKRNNSKTHLWRVILIFLKRLKTRKSLCIPVTRHSLNRSRPGAPFLHKSDASALLCSRQTTWMFLLRANFLTEILTMAKKNWGGLLNSFFGHILPQTCFIFSKSLYAFANVSISPQLDPTEGTFSIGKRFQISPAFHQIPVFLSQSFFGYSFPVPAFMPYRRFSVEWLFANKNHIGIYFSAFLYRPAAVPFKTEAERRFRLVWEFNNNLVY